MDAFSFDHIRVFLTVVEAGGFSAAARKLNRAQSAITYAIQKLEEQVGLPLFDRSGYRPVLTDTGRALLPRARRINEDVGAFRVHARHIADGIEPELSLALTAMFPLPMMIEALKAFQREFPTVQTRIYIESLGGAVGLLADGTCALGMVVAGSIDESVMNRVPIVDVNLLPVVAPDHALAAIGDSFPTDMLRDHVQIVLTDRSGFGPDRDFGVFSTHTWRVGDLAAKHALLRAGLGWGTLPEHLIEDDLRRGDLVRIHPGFGTSGDRPVRLSMVGAYRSDRPLRPAADWMLRKLVELADTCPIKGKPKASGGARHEREQASTDAVLASQRVRPLAGPMVDSAKQSRGRKLPR